MLTTTLPFFVYGTLRHGQGNYRSILEGFTTKELPARMPGLDMYGDRGFPYALLNEDNDYGVVGEVMWVREEFFESTLGHLDALEGYRPGDPDSHQHYLRVVRPVLMDDGTTVDVFVYVASKSTAAYVIGSTPHVPSGDWNLLSPPRPVSRAWGYGSVSH